MYESPLQQQIMERNNNLNDDGYKKLRSARLTGGSRLTYVRNLFESDESISSVLQPSHPSCALALAVANMSRQARRACARFCFKGVILREIEKQTKTSKQAGNIGHRTIPSVTVFSIPLSTIVSTELNKS